jgi:radical SAM protein with 4Fe4S-binding SPASM domain
MEIKYVLNHFYKLRHDIKRSHILAPSYIDKEYASMVQTGWMSRIHPVFAMALSLFTKPLSLAVLKKEFSFFFNISEIQAESFIKLFINNTEKFTINYDGGINYFPKNIVIDASKQFVDSVQYLPEQFAYKDLDLERERFYVAPSTLVFMVNNTCATDCVYCYANKTIKSVPIAFDRLKKIIEEACNLYISKFTLVGGEVFLYKYWRELLKLLQKNGLNETLISTKVPINENDIISLKEFDLNVQISLDAIDSVRLQKILKVKMDYAEKIQQTIKLLDKHAINFQISTVLTKYNNTIGNLNALYDFLIQFKFLRRWEIRVAFKSLYSREDFHTIKLSREEINEIDTWIKETQQKSTINISWSANEDDKYFKGENGSRTFKGSRCSANYSNLFILPDGKVSICEQLYWDSRFIIGDLTKQSIKEIWNSPKALALSFPKKENFRNCSLCKTCDIFDECMNYSNRCIADILKGYGMENWDYPDPRCNKAPQFTHNLLNE